MTITREDLDAGRVDFSDIDTGEPIEEATPGKILRQEFLAPMGLSAKALARQIGVPTNRVTAILHGTRAITADTAVRLGERFATSAEFWMNLQVAHDLRIARAQRRAA